MAVNASLVVSVKDLEPVRDLLAQLSLLHRKSKDTIEIEWFHDDPDNMRCEDLAEGGGCAGHFRDIHICEQCGYGTDDYGDAIWLEWPCRTAKLLRLDQ